MPTRFAPILLGLVCALPSAAGEVPAFAKDVPTVRAGELAFAFDGKSLDGFYAYTRKHKIEDPAGVFSVRDGMIRASGEDYGGLATKATYRDYHLIVEWKWGEQTWGDRKSKARDSGVLLHCVGPDGAAGGQWMESLECQIIEGGTGDFIMVKGLGKPSLSCETRIGDDKGLYFSAGGTLVTRDSGRFNWWGRDPAWKDELGFRGRFDVEKPAGEWNRLEVFCKGDTITNTLNGQIVNAGTRSSLTEGKIQLQSEGAEIFFRKFEVRPLLK